MTTFFDALETRSADARASDIAKQLPEQIKRAQSLGGYGDGVRDVNPSDIKSVDDLGALPVLRKSELSAQQSAQPPFGGFSNTQHHHIFQSPGPIYEPGMKTRDWWRIGRFLHACGIGTADVVQNCFSYHFTPAGMIFESGAEAVGATVFPAGTGQTELQVRAASDIGTTAYAGTPDYLKVILDKADELGTALTISKAAVGGGPLFPALRQEYQDRGITCLQNYATADLGNIAYESTAMEGMIVDEGVIVEIVTPGTGNRVQDGEIGEVVVTTLNPDYPLIRFATGDLSSIMAGVSPCGRTNNRITGWKGRADQATKVKGMFVRPEQVADLVSRHGDVQKARVIVRTEGQMDAMTVQLETDATAPEVYDGSIRDVLKLRGSVELVPPGSLPKDGIVIEDARDFS